MPRLTPPDRSRRAFLAIAAVSLLLTLDTGLRGMAALGQTGFDSPEVRAASDVVLPALLRGPHYQLGPTVRTFAFMNQYLVASDYGAFTATSDARLRRLVREIAAIAELQKIHQSDAFAKATVEAGKGVVQGAQHLIQDPAATIGAVPEAVFSVFGRVSEATKRGGRSKYEDGVAQNLLAVSSFKREFAEKFDIDVYSSNEVLQKELNRVAWAAAAGNLTLGAASMVTGAVVLQVASGVRNLEQAKSIVNALPPTELSRRDREALRQMRVPDPVTDRFLENRLLSPRHQTVIVEAMKALRGVPGPLGVHPICRVGRQREHCFAVSADGGTPCRLPSIGRADPASRHLPERPRSLHRSGIGRYPAADRSAAVDRSNLGDCGQPRPDIAEAATARKVEVWLTGDASDRALQGLQQLGVTLVEHVGQRLPLLD